MVHGPLFSSPNQCYDIIIALCIVGNPRLISSTKIVDEINRGFPMNLFIGLNGFSGERCGPGTFCFLKKI